MDKTITLKVLGPADFDILLAVPDGLFDETMRPEQVRAFLDDPLHECVLAFDGDLAVGMATGVIMFHPDKAPSMFVNEVGVRDEYLRRGIGRAVTERMFDIARTKGCKGIWLGTEADNAPALALYRSMKGEEVTGVYFGWDDAF